MAQVQQAAGQAQEKMQQATGQAQEKVQQATGQAKGKAREQIDQRTTQAGERISTTAGDVRSVGEELRKQGKDAPARVADQVANRAERFGGYLKESDSDRILRDVEDFGRRQPWAVAAGGLVLGFAASRFLKASSRKRYEASQTGRTDGEARSAAQPVAPTTPPTATAGAPAAPAGGGLEPNR